LVAARIWKQQGFGGGEDFATARMWMQQGSCSGQDVHGPWEQGFGGKKDGGEDFAATRIWR